MTTYKDAAGREANPTAAAERQIVVVVGTGSIGMRHLHVFEELLGAKVIAVPKRAARIADLRKDGFTGCAGIAEAMHSGGELLVVASDTAAHVDDALAGIAAGARGILIEKPIACTADGLAELRERARAIEHKIFVACNLRFESGINLFRERLAEIGEIHHVRIEAQSYLPNWRPERDYRQSYSADAEQGGVLRDLIHEIDYAVWLFGRPVEVKAMLSNSGRLGIAAEESADLLWKAPQGATVSLRLDYVTRSYRRAMTAFGSLGELAWDMPAHTVTLRKGTSAPVVDTYVQERNAMMAEQAAAFVDAVNEGGATQLATIDDGIFAVALCDAARRSDASGRSERIAI